MDTKTIIKNSEDLLKNIFVNQKLLNKIYKNFDYELNRKILQFLSYFFHFSDKYTNKTDLVVKYAKLYSKLIKQKINLLKFDTINHDDFVIEFNDLKIYIQNIFNFSDEELSKHSHKEYIEVEKIVFSFISGKKKEEKIKNEDLAKSDHSEINDDSELNLNSFFSNDYYPFDSKPKIVLFFKSCLCFVFISLMVASILFCIYDTAITSKYSGIVIVYFFIIISYFSYIYRFYNAIVARIHRMMYYFAKINLILNILSSFILLLCSVLLSFKFDFSQIGNTSSIIGVVIFVLAIINIILSMLAYFFNPKLDKNVLNKLNKTLSNKLPYFLNMFKDKYNDDDKDNMKKHKDEKNN